jgi:hypothetical protein
MISKTTRVPLLVLQNSDFIRMANAPRKLSLCQFGQISFEAYFLINLFLKLQIANPTGCTTK